MGLLSFLRVFGGRKRTGLEQYETTNWDSPDLQPINGVSLQTYVAVMRTNESEPLRPQDAQAEQAGVSPADWKLAHIGWQVRLTSKTEVKAAMTKVYAPTTTFRRNYDNPV